MISHWDLSETRLEMMKHMRSETQDNGVKAYLSFCCLVYTPITGHCSFIYSTQKLTCQTTRYLKVTQVTYLSKSWKAHESCLKDLSSSVWELPLLHWKVSVFHLLEWKVSLISQRCSFFKFQQAWRWQILPFYSVCIPVWKGFCNVVF